MLLFALFIAGLSEGLEPALQGLATALDMGRHARMFTTVAVIETVGKLIGGPGMARLFAIGRSGGHGSMGICFLAASVGNSLWGSLLREVRLTVYEGDLFASTYCRIDHESKALRWQYRMATGSTRHNRYFHPKRWLAYRPKTTRQR